MKVRKLVQTAGRTPKKEVRERERKNERNEMFWDRSRSDREREQYWKNGSDADGTRKAGKTQPQKREKEVKVSLVKRMEVKKENYIKKLERSRVWWYSATGMQHGGLSKEWSVSYSFSFFSIPYF